MIRVLKALIAPCSSPPVSWNTSLIGVPSTPPLSLKYFSAILAPATCSWPSKATLLACATPTPTGIAVEFPAAEPCGEVAGDGEVPGDTVVDVWGVFV